jgi:hypothetical protein
VNNQRISGASPTDMAVNVDDLELGHIRRDGKKRVRILVECLQKKSPDCHGRRFVSKTGAIQSKNQTCKPCNILRQTDINGGFFRS